MQVFLVLEHKITEDDCGNDSSEITGVIGIYQNEDDAECIRQGLTEDIDGMPYYYSISPIGVQ